MKIMSAGTYVRNIYRSGYMSNQQVNSKNLFNFRPQGYVDKDIVAFYEKMKTDFNIDMVK